jgi:hypothetical protein
MTTALIALEHVVADEADLRAALVDMSCKYFWLHAAYRRVLDVADDARMAAVRERDQFAVENERLRDQLTFLLQQTMREAA